MNWAQALQGRTLGRRSLSDATFDEQQFIETHQREAPFFLTFVYVARLHLNVMLEQFSDALVAAREARAVAVTGTIWPVLIDFWGGLAAAAAFDDATEDERSLLRRELVSAEKTLAELTETCPENFRCMSLVLSAEIKRAESHVDQAVTLLDDAISYAHQTANLQQEALANELCARIWLRRDDEFRARRFMNEAYRCYAAWGARSKLEHLEEHYGELLTATVYATTIPAATVDPGGPAERVSVDMSTVLKVAHAIAVEMQVDDLLRKLMALALENAGAERGIFVQERQGALLVEANAGTDRDHIVVGSTIPLEEANDLAISVVRYVHRTGQDVVMGNATRDERFSGDRYILASRAKSILCVPVAHQGRLRGILYLENNLTTDAFTPDRIEMMRILAAQAAISLENARLYENMKSEVERRTAAEQALREALSEVEGLKNRLEAENVYLQEEIRNQHNFNEIVGNSPALLDTLRKVERVAPTDSTVLIVGETGSGKELFARAVHNRSRRSDRPLVKVELRRHRTWPGRKRALRARQRSVHRRHREASRPIRAGQWRHDLSRRDRRAAARRTGEAAPRPSGAGVRAGRQQPNSARQRPSHCGHESKPRSGCPRRKISRRSAVPAERLSDRRPAVARAHVGYPTARRILLGRSCATIGKPIQGFSAGAWNGLSRIPGRATCANCRTSSSGRPFWRRGQCSNLKGRF